MMAQYSSLSDASPLIPTAPITRSSAFLTSTPPGKIDLVKKDGKWHMTEPFDADVDFKSVRRLLDVMKKVKAESWIDGPESAAVRSLKVGEFWQQDHECNKGGSVCPLFGRLSQAAASEFGNGNYGLSHRDGIIAVLRKA